MPVTDQSGNMLPPTSEGLLEYVRRTREAKYAKLASSDANIIDNVQQPIQDNTSINRGTAEKFSIDNDRDSVKRREKTQYIHGGDTSFTNIERGTNDFAGNTRPIDREPTASYGGADQYSRSGKEPIHTNFLTGVRKAIQPIKEVIQERSKGETKKKKKIFDGAKKLNDTEGVKLRPKLIESFTWQCEHADQFMQATTKGHKPVEIWSNLDEDEIEILVDFLLERAKVNPQVAVIVREMGELMLKIKVGTITLPRAYASFMVYIQRGFSIV